jgi:phosphoesterase RecJ-like protein
VIDTGKYTKELSSMFSSADNILLISHINPDGDAIGSQMALYYYLRSIGKSTDLLTPNNLQDFLKWMDPENQINVFIKDRKKGRKIIEQADLIVMLDFNQSNRLGEAEDTVLKSSAKKIIIDHHLNPGTFASLVISDPDKCATAELVHEIISNLNGSPFRDKAYSEAVYVGIITDTGNFEHGSYSPDTFRIAAELLESGVEKARILNLIYNNFSSERMRLLGYALNKRMVVLPELKTAYIYLTMDDLKEYSHAKGDTEGFVNMPLSIRGIHFTALFIEKEGFIKLSFRSKGKFPTNEFASQYFGGGGHLNASGGEYYDTLGNTLDYFLKVLNENTWRFEDDI